MKSRKLRAKFDSECHFPVKEDHRGMLPELRNSRRKMASFNQIPGWDHLRYQEIRRRILGRG
jgi:hypothetical protein